MPSDTAQADEGRDPMDGTAAVQPVTAEMMDHAAREAAALVDRAAQGGMEAAAGAVDATASASSAAADAAEAAARDAAGAAGRAVDEARGAAEAAREGLSGSADALGRYNAKVFEVMRANMASTTALFAALVQAKSVPEALSINADHMRRQMEALTSQGRELATLAQGFALEAMRASKGRIGG